MKRRALQLFGLSWSILLGCSTPPEMTGAGGRGGYGGGGGASDAAAGTSGGNLGSAGVGTSGGAGMGGAVGSGGVTGSSGGGRGGGSGGVGGAAGISGGGGVGGAAGSPAGGGGGVGGAAGSPAGGGGAAVGGTRGGAGSGGATGAGGEGAVGPRIYALLGHATTSASLEVVDATTWTLVRNVPLSNGGGGDIEVDPSSQRVYVTHGYQVSVVDATAGTELALISSQPQTLVQALALSNDRSRLYVLGLLVKGGGYGGQVVMEIDTATLSVREALTMTDGGAAAGIALSPDGSTLVLGWDGMVSSGIGARFLTTAGDLTVDATVSITQPLGQFHAISPAFTDDGRVLLFSSYFLYVIPFDVASRSALSAINPYPSNNKPGSCAHRCLAYDPVTKTAVAGGNYYDIVVANLTTNTARMEAVADGGFAEHVESPPGGGPIYVSVQNSGTPPKADTVQAYDSRLHTVYTFSDSTKPVDAFRVTNAVP